MAGAVAFLIAAGWAVIAGRIVFVDTIGPTVATLTPEHGVHAGDVLALPAVVLALVTLSAGVSLLERGLARHPVLAPLRPRPVRTPDRSS